MLNPNMAMKLWISNIFEKKNEKFCPCCARDIRVDRVKVMFDNIFFYFYSNFDVILQYLF